MKKILLTATALFISSLSFANAPIHINSQDVSKLTWQEVPFSQTVKTVLSDQQSQPFTQNFAGIASPIAAYKIPANQGNLQIEIISPILDKNVFVPSAVVLDSHFNVSASYPSSAFKFQEERGLQPNRFTAELDLTPSTGQDYIYLLIYTTEQDLATKTTVPHPAKLYAKATGRQPPAIDDIVVSHSKNGEIQINVTNGSGTRFIGLPQTVFSSNEKPTTTVIAPQKSEPAVNAPIDKDTETYFKQAVTKALKENNVNKALNLVNEAEKLGLTSPRQIFLQKVSSK